MIPLIKLLVCLVFLLAPFSANAKTPLLSKNHQYDIQLGTSLDHKNQFSVIAEISVTSKRAKVSAYGIKSGKDRSLGLLDFERAMNGFQSSYIKDQIGMAIGKGKYDTLSTSYLQFGLGVSRKTDFLIDSTQGLSRQETYFPHLLARTGSQLELGVLSVGFDFYGLLDTESISLGVTTKFGIGKYWFK